MIFFCSFVKGGSREVRRAKRGVSVLQQPRVEVGRRPGPVPPALHAPVGGQRRPQGWVAIS